MELSQLRGFCYHEALPNVTVTHDREICFVRILLCEQLKMIIFLCQFNVKMLPLNLFSSIAIYQWCCRLQMQKSSAKFGWETPFVFFPASSLFGDCVAAFLDFCLWICDEWIWRTMLYPKTHNFLNALAFFLFWFHCRFNTYKIRFFSLWNMLLLKFDQSHNDSETECLELNNLFQPKNCPNSD